MNRIAAMWKTVKGSSLTVKGLLIVVVLYVLIPFDLVSDFIPIFGFGDDFLALLVTLVGLYEKSKKTDAAAEKDKK